MYAKFIFIIFRPIQSLINYPLIILIRNMIYAINTINMKCDKIHVNQPKLMNFSIPK